MIIHQPEIFQQNGHTILWAKIELNKEAGFFPEYVWYRVPCQYGAYFTTQSDQFLVPGLLAGMFFGEDIEVRGQVSPKLAYHFEEYKYLLNFHYPKLLKQVEIKFNQLAPLNEKPKGVGITFSGGVDSLFTLWKHIPQNQPDPDYQITHGIYIKGFDTLHSEEKIYWLLYNHFNKWGSKLDLELIPLETNISGISHQRLPSPHFIGPLLLGPAISLAGLFRRFYLSSTFTYIDLMKITRASNPYTDSILSTESLQIIHYGATHRRVEKMMEIADWDFAKHVLRVCQANKLDHTTMNCSRCEKCVRTMIPLYALGKLDKFSTFAKPITKNWEGLLWARKFSPKEKFVIETVKFVKKHKAAFFPWVAVAVLIGSIRHIIVTKMPRVLKGWLRLFGLYVTRKDAPDAYEFPVINTLIRTEYDHPRT